MDFPLTLLLISLSLSSEWRLLPLSSTHGPAVSWTGNRQPKESPLCHIDFGLHPFLNKKSIHLLYGRLTSRAAKQERKKQVFHNHYSQLLKLHVSPQPEGEGNRDKIPGLSILKRGSLVYFSPLGSLPKHNFVES
ncbi:hypothetical protein TNCV_1880251 [Trichonephila clavipes]|nr:hypothetical protein TNCV_1880251 [Trichonephila clavipes]